MAPKTRGKRKDYAAMEAGGEVPEADTGAVEQPQPKVRRRARKVRGPGAPEAAPSGAFAPAPAAESDSAADQEEDITAGAVELFMGVKEDDGPTYDIQPVLEVSALFEHRYLLNPYEGDMENHDWSPQYTYKYTLKLWDGAETIAGYLHPALNPLVREGLDSGRRIKLTSWFVEVFDGKKQLWILNVEVLGPAVTLSARAEEALSVVLLSTGVKDFRPLGRLAMASKSLHKVITSDMMPWAVTAARMSAAAKPPPLPEGWTELSDDDGNKFYYNATENKTVTRRPMDYESQAACDYDPLGARLTKTQANAILKLTAKDLKPGTWVDNISFIEHRLSSRRSNESHVAHLYDATDLIQIAAKKFKKNGGLPTSVSMANRRYKKHLFADLQGAKSAERSQKLRWGRDFKAIRTAATGTDRAFLEKMKALVQELEEQLIEEQLIEE